MKIDKIIITQPAKKVLRIVEQKSHNLNDHIEHNFNRMADDIPENSTVKVSAPKLLNFFVDVIKLSFFKDDKRKFSTRIFFPKKIPPELAQKTWDYVSPLTYNKPYVALRKKIVGKIQDFSNKIK